MKKSVAIQISIPEPCPQAWDDMQPMQGGKHCAHCQKTVMDFTRMTDTQLLAYFQKNTESTCGRLTAEQVNRIIRPVEVQRSNWWSQLAAGVLLALGLSRNAGAQIKNNKQNIETPQSTIKDNQYQAMTSRVESTSHNDSFEVYGVLTDEKKNPIVNSIVQLLGSDRDSVLGITTTDFDGNYKIKILSASADNLYRIQFSYLGYMASVTNIPFQKKPKRINKKVDFSGFTLGLIMKTIVTHSDSVQLPDPPGQRTIKDDMLNPGSLR